MLKCRHCTCHLNSWRFLQLFETRYGASRSQWLQQLPRDVDRRLSERFACSPVHSETAGSTNGVNGKGAGVGESRTRQYPGPDLSSHRNRQVGS